MAPSLVPGRLRNMLTRRNSHAGVTRTTSPTSSRASLKQQGSAIEEHPPVIPIPNYFQLADNDGDVAQDGAGSPTLCDEERLSRSITVAGAQDSETANSNAADEQSRDIHREPTSSDPTCNNIPVTTTTDDSAPPIQHSTTGAHTTTNQLETTAPKVARPSIVATPATGGSRSSLHQPVELQRGQSLLSRDEGALYKALLHPDLPRHPSTNRLDYLAHIPTAITANMVHRKIWVKRPGASATMISIHEDDLVDDIRDMILRKYANSLGRNFDAPDVTLRVLPREHRQEKLLGPEESMARILDSYYPGGQTVEEALIIDVPLRRTPKPSPRGVYYDDGRPTEAGGDYFPPMPVVIATNASANGSVHHPPPHAMSVLSTGHVPTLPSPIGTRRHHRERPRVGRTHTTSPQTGPGPTSNPSNASQPITYVNRVATRSRTHSSASETSAVPPVAPPLPTPPPPPVDPIQHVATPPVRPSSPRPTKLRKSKRNFDHPTMTSSMLNSTVPPINVLIVEDNIINLKLLEALMKRLKVRCQTAINGREAVNKWRSGGFHLVLMDIQLPIMSGLEATKEIRRLERLNHIGVFSSSASDNAPELDSTEPADADLLPEGAVFKSPVIIVALTAGSLQSDRHGALAAGCNDFLTKPVNFVWLERKVMEWGCMQALIDYDGWRKWKDFSSSMINGVGPASGGGGGGDAKQQKRRKNRASIDRTTVAAFARKDGSTDEGASEMVVDGPMDNNGSGVGVGMAPNVLAAA